MTAGFYGKLPARGDFVRFGLPRGFTDPWDAWLAAALAASRARLGEAWLPAFLESPVWRFLLSPGLCGDRAVLGLMMPSVDRAGRYFPLTFAVLCSAAPVEDAAWLDRCEAAGRAALEQDAAPEEVGAIMGAPAQGDAATVPPGHSLWWTDGAPRVSATRFSLLGMPTVSFYATMLDDALAEGARRDAMMPQATGEVADMQATRTERNGGRSWEPAP